MNRTIACIIAIILILTSVAWAESFSGKVLSVIDGNNIIVERNNQLCRIRLIGIECPDLDQPFGTQAKELVLNMVLGKEVWVDVKGTDHDGRLLSSVVIDGKNVAMQAIMTGLAWYEPKFHHFRDLAEAEEMAKSSQIGLWACSDSKHPRFFRQERRGIIPVASGAPCHSGASNYGFVEASTPGDYTSIGSVGSPGGSYYYDNYYYPSYYQRGYNRSNHNFSNTQTTSQPKSIFDPAYVKSQRSVFDRK